MTDSLGSYGSIEMQFREWWAEALMRSMLSVELRKVKWERVEKDNFFRPTGCNYIMLLFSRVTYLRDYKLFVAVSCWNGNLLFVRSAHSTAETIVSSGPGRLL